MKILQVIDQLEIGGAERVAIDMTNLLSDASLSISLMVLREKTSQDELLNESVPVFYLKRKSKFNIKYLFKLSSIVKHYDIVHVHMRHTFLYVQLVVKLFKINSKVILHDHFGGIHKDDRVPFFLNSFLKPVYYIGVSKQLIDWSKNRLKVDGIDTVFLLSNVVIKQEVKPLTSRNGWVIVGNIKPVKNQLFAINLAAQCKKHLTIIGKIQDKRYYTVLKEAIIANQQEQNVNFIHHENDPQQLLNQFELALMPSASESGPLVLIEYLAQSLPFISYKTGEVSRILSDKIPESFVDSFEIVLWKKKIDVLGNKKFDFENLYNTYFSPSNYCKKCIMIYKQILKNS